MSSSNEIKIVDRCGPYEIFKVSLVNPALGKRLKLGVVVRSREWMRKDLAASFPTCNEYAYIHEVKSGSLADQAGVLPHDILCLYTRVGEPLGLFHDLLVQGKKKNANPNNNPAKSAAKAAATTREEEEEEEEEDEEDEPTWKLMTGAYFEYLLSRDEYDTQFSFYIARKGSAMESSIQKHTGKLRKSGVVLSSDITQRAQSYHSLSQEEQEELLEDARANARLHFEAERDAVLKALPAEYKQMFWQIGFVKWGRSNAGTLLPALILDPYHVPPGQARDAWLRKFQSRKEKSTLEKMHYMIYWYGEAADSPSDGCFSIIAPESFIPWTEAKKQGLHKPTKKGLPKKIDRVKLANEASRLPASRRKEVLPEVEEYCDLLCAEDLAQYAIIPPPPPTSSTTPNTGSAARRMSTTSSTSSSTNPKISATSARSNNSEQQQRGKRRRITSFASSKVEWEERAEIQPCLAMSTQPILAPPAKEGKLPTVSTRTTRASNPNQEEMISLPMTKPKTPRAPKQDPPKEKEAPTPVVEAEPKVVLATCAKPPPHKKQEHHPVDSDGAVIVAHVSPLLRKRPPARHEDTAAPRKRLAVLPVQTAKISTTPVSSSSDESTSLEDDGDAKPVATTKPAAKTSASSSTSSVQTVLDTFCQQIQEVSRRNQVLKTKNELLHSTIKNWREQYNRLAGAMGEKIAAPSSVSPNSNQNNDDIVSGDKMDIGDENYFHNMHVFLKKVTKQNAKLEHENAQLEEEAGGLQSNFLWLVDSVKSSRNK